MKLVDDIENIWKRWSVRLVAAQVVLIATWAGFSAIGWTPNVPDWLKWTVVLIFGAAAVTAANFKQKNLPPSQTVVDGEGYARKPDAS